MSHLIPIQAVGYAREFKELGIFEADLGSISYRDGGNMWITKSGQAKFQPDGLVLVDKEGNLLDDSDVKLSGEYPIHRRILYSAEKNQAVIHTHAAFHIAFGNIFPNYCFDAPALVMRKLLDIRDPEASYTLQAIPNSFDKEELAFNVARILHEDIAVLVQNHGLFVAATSLPKARKYVFAIDHMMRQVNYQRLLGS